MKDMIEKTIWIDAPLQAVWSALVDAGEFGTWFRAKVEGPLEKDRTVWLESLSKGHEGVRFWLRPVRFDEPNQFEFDWPAGDAPTDADPQKSQTNRVTFDLAEEGGGTRVTVTESGFASLPKEIAERKYPDNTKGWEIQLENIKAHVEG
ncbi:SRPBCC domain-containing protein [Pseudoruegeria sp. HB172150]|uniref:SRPBCC domain-containing protein n=1 Tax=Pseudoruegeria sp. HB172150 TaxID=2721164 RepID=UPI0015535893|nr:SRPBCC domain-containing protein [Pseudoruegeria sp. HB172150]